MSRRLIESENMNLQTYPTVSQWLDKAKTEWINEGTGLPSSFLGIDGGYREWLPVKSSYSALNCYYQTLLDEEFAEVNVHLDISIIPIMLGYFLS